MGRGASEGWKAGGWLDGLTNERVEGKRMEGRQVRVDGWKRYGVMTGRMNG